MIAMRGMGRNTTNGEHGNIVFSGYGLRGGFIIPPVPESPPLTPIPGSGGGRVDPGYGRQHEDALKETRHKRIMQEDDEILALIMAALTRNLL